MMKSVEGRQQVEDDIALDLRGLMSALGRNALRILIVTILFGAGTFLLLDFLAPVYQAETKLLIENREVDLGREAVSSLERSAVDQETVASQVQLLTSRDLARRVAEKHRLMTRDEFNGTKGTVIDALKIAVGLGSDLGRVSIEERVLDEFAEHLEVFLVEGSRVVVVRFQSEDRVLAADVANSIASEYMALQGEAKRRTSEDQTRWLGEEIEALRGKVRDAEEAVERFRSGSDLFVGENETSVARQQITQLTESIAAAHSDQSEADSRAELLAGLLRTGASLAPASDVIDTETFRSLRTREIALRSRASELSVTLLPGHPQVKAINAQISDIAGQQAAEARRVLAGYQNDSRVAERRIVSLTDQLNQLKATQAQDNESGVELRALEREAASQRSLLEGMLLRYREAVARQNADVLPADARVISRAATPVEPVFPRVLPLTVVATLAGLLLSVALVIGAEFLSGRALVPIAIEPEKPQPVAPMVTDHPTDAGTDDDPPPGHAAVEAPAPEKVPSSAAEARLERFRSLTRDAIERKDALTASEISGAAATDETSPGGAAPSASALASALRAVAAAEAATALPSAAGIAKAPESSGEPDRTKSSLEATADAGMAADSAAPMAPPPPSVPVRDLAGLHGMLVADGSVRIALMGLGERADVERMAKAFTRHAAVGGTRIVVVETVPDGSDEPGLADLVAGLAKFGEIIRRNPETLAHEIRAGRRSLEPELATGEAVETMLRALEQTYDLVLVNLGLLDPDTAHLEFIFGADHTVLVGDPADEAVELAIGALSKAGIKAVSVLPIDDEPATTAAA